MRAGWVGQSTPLRISAFSICISAFEFPSKKSSLQKSSAFEFCEPHPPRARSARHAAESVVFFVGGQRKPPRIESCLYSGDSIQPRSNLFYQPLIFARSARAVALYFASRFDSVVILSGARVRAPSNPRPAAFHSFVFFAGGMQN